MAFSGQTRLEFGDGLFCADPVEGSLAQSYRIWRMIRRNRGSLAQVLPGVVVKNNSPLSTYKRQRALAESTDQEGYVIVDAGDTSLRGIATLRALPNPRLGEGLGIQMDFWLDAEIDGREVCAPGLCRALIARADAISVSEGLELPPYALISAKNPNSDPSREFRDVSALISCGSSSLAAQPAGFNGNQESYELLARFSPQQTETI